MLNQYIVTQGICTITTCICFRTRHNSQGCYHQFLYQLSHCWDRLPPEGDLLSHYWDYLSPEGGLLSHCWDYLSPEGGFFVPFPGLFVSQRSFLSHCWDYLYLKEVSCPIADLFVSRWGFFVPFPGLFVSGRKFFVSLLGLFVSPEGGFLSHFWTLCLPKEAFCPISGLFVSRKRLFVPFLDSLSPEGSFFSHCWNYLFPEGGFSILFLGLFVSRRRFFCHKQKYTKTKAVSSKAGTKFLWCSVTPKVVCKWKLEWWLDM